MRGDAATSNKLHKLSENKTGEPSPNHGRDRDSILSDDPDKTYVLGIGTNHRDRPSRESHSVEDFCPGRVRTSVGLKLARGKPEVVVKHT